MRKPASPAKGKLLLAHPFLLDPNFHRSVIFLTEHGVQGSIGFILNKSLDLALDKAVEDFPVFSAPLFLGGPVQHGTLHFLHKLGKKIEGAIEIIDGVFWGGDFNELKSLIKEQQIEPQDIQFFIGYAGWGGGQLTGELQQNSWIVTSATPEDIFITPRNDMWTGILREMGGKYALLAAAPQHPSLN